MNLYEARDFFKNLHKDKNILLEFDDKCLRFLEVVFHEGKPNPIHHKEYRLVKVTVEGNEPQYVPIQPHRECCTWEDAKGLLNSK